MPKRQRGNKMSKPLDNNGPQPKPKSCGEMAQETRNFSNLNGLNEILPTIFRKACKSNSKFPLIFVAEEIYKMSGDAPFEPKLPELRKNVDRFQKLLDHLKQRDVPTKSTEDPNNDDKIYREYHSKHDLKKHLMELTAISYMVEAENPLMFIANYILKQPDSKLLIQKEIQDLEKKEQIYKNLIKHFIDKNPLTPKEIQDFSVNTINDEHLVKKSAPSHA